MAKKGLIRHNQLRISLVEKFKDRRLELKNQIISVDDIDEKLKLIQKLDGLPKNSSAVRVRNRCALTGRPRSYDKRTGFCRMVSRQYISEGLLPGFVKGKR
jgi:small subunit ribosomal protein S14